MNQTTKSAVISASSIAHHHALQCETLDCKANVCRLVLSEARRLAEGERFGAALAQLIARTDDLLDEMDEILIGLHPVRSAREFCLVAALHRDLEHLQAMISKQRSRTRNAS